MTTRREWANVKRKCKPASDWYFSTPTMLDSDVIKLLKAERARARRAVRRYIKELKDIDKYEQGDTGWQQVALEELLRRL